MTIGTIYFALVDAGIAFDPNVHNVKDELVFSLKVSQAESEFASAQVEIVNPRIGLLNPARKKRVFISYDDGATAQLLFSGRIIGFPTDLSTETIKLEYIAQAETWEADQDTFIQTLKVAPYYNELFATEDRRNDPAEILASRGSLLNWDRTTNAVSLSDIIQGASLIELTDTPIFDSVRVQIGDPPLNSINISIEAQWEQFGVGVVDCGTPITAEFINTAIGTEQINTLTPQAFEDAWRGVNVPNGYEVVETKLIPVANSHGLAIANLRSGTITVNASDFPTKNGGILGTRPVSVPRVWYNGIFTLQSIYEQKRREVFTTQLLADLQDFSLRGDRSEDLVFRLQDPTAAAQSEVFNGKLPSFFYDNVLAEQSTLGREVVEHALLRARSRLLKANRVIETRLDVELESVIDISCDTSIHFNDDRIPGGEIRGKVIEYTLSIDGNSGQQIARITIASTIGVGEDSVPLGTPDQVEIANIFYDNNGVPGYSEIIDEYTFDGDTYDHSAQDLTPAGITFSTDGMTMYLSGKVKRKIFQYSLAVAFTPSSATLVAESIALGVSPLDTAFSPDGTKLFFMASSAIKQYTLTTPWDITTLVYVTQFFLTAGGETFALSSDGSKFLIGNIATTLWQYSIATPWDISTASYDTVTTTLPATITDLRGMVLNNSGTKLYTVGMAEFEVRQFDLPNPNTLVGITDSGIVKDVSALVSPLRLKIIPDGSFFYVGDGYPASTIYRLDIAGGAAGHTSSIWYDLNATPTISEPIDVALMESDDQYLVDLVTVDADGEVQTDLFLAENVTTPEFGTGRPDTVLENNPTTITIDLKSMNPSSEILGSIDIQTSDLTIPRQVDLEA